MQLLEPSTLILILAGILLAYRLIVAVVFGALASKMRGRFSISSGEAITVAVVSFFDTVLGLFVLGMSALTKETDVKGANAIISRLKADISFVSDILYPVKDPDVENLRRDALLLGEKLTQIEEDPAVGRNDVIGVLERTERDFLYLRDKADDINLEEDATARNRLVASCRRRMEGVLEGIEKVLSLLT